MVLEDHTGRIEVTLFDDVHRQYRDLVIKDEMLVVEGQLRFDDFLNDWRLTARNVSRVDETIEQRALRLTIRWPSGQNGTDLVHELKRVLDPFVHGTCKVSIEYAGSRASARLTLGDRWTVRVTRDLREQLSSLLGPDGYSVHYPKHPG